MAEEVAGGGASSSWIGCAIGLSTISPIRLPSHFVGHFVCDFFVS